MEIQEFFQLLKQRAEALQVTETTVKNTLQRMHAKLTEIAISPIDELYNYLEYTAPFFGVIVEKKNEPYDDSKYVPSRGVTSALVEIANRLQADENPYAMTALQLLEEADSTGYIRESDESLANRLKFPVDAVRAARSLLIERFGIGYRHLADYWIRMASTEGGLPPTEIKIIRILSDAVMKRQYDKSIFLKELQRHGIDETVARETVQKFIHLFGLHPLQPEKPEAIYERHSPDIIVSTRSGELTWSIRTPEIKILKANVDGATDSRAVDTSIGLILIPEHVQELFQTVLLGIPDYRRKMLDRIMHLIAEVNGPWLLRKRYYRLNVPFSKLKETVSNTRLSGFYRLIVSVDGQDYKLYELLGYDRSKKGYVIHYPIKDIAMVLDGQVSTRSLMDAYKMLKQYGFSLTYHQFRMTWSHIQRMHKKSEM